MACLLAGGAASPRLSAAQPCRVCGPRRAQLAATPRPLLLGSRERRAPRSSCRSGCRARALPQTTFHAARRSRRPCPASPRGIRRLCVCPAACASVSARLLNWCSPHSARTGQVRTPRDQPKMAGIAAATSTRARTARVLARQSQPRSPSRAAWSPLPPCRTRRRQRRRRTARSSPRWRAPQPSTRSGVATRMSRPSAARATSGGCAGQLGAPRCAPGALARAGKGWNARASSSCEARAQPRRLRTPCVGCKRTPPFALARARRLRRGQPFGLGCVR